MELSEAMLVEEAKETFLFMEGLVLLDENEPREGLLWFGDLSNDGDGARCT